MAAGDETRGEILHHLSSCMYRSGNEIRVRSDFLGYEVDRFFRTTKAAIPQCVTIGQGLAARLYLADGATLPVTSVGHTKLTRAQLEIPGVGSVKNDWKVVRKELPKEQLPGCDEDYVTFHIFWATDVPKIAKETRRDPLKIGQTREVLEQHGLLGG